MKKFCLLVITLIIYSPTWGISVHQIYGDKDVNFIKGYYTRLFDTFFTINPDFEVCISKELRDSIKTNIIKKYSGWGQTFLDGALLLPNLEVYYRSVSAEGGLEKGVRIRLPEDTKIHVNGHMVDRGNNAFGFEVYLNKDQKCVTNKIQKFMSHLLYSDGRKLELKAVDYVDVRQYPFMEQVQGKIGEGENAIIHLKSFTLLYLNQKPYDLVNRHLKEFHQILLRISWKDKDHYTIYYPQ